MMDSNAARWSLTLTLIACVAALAWFVFNPFNDSLPARLKASHTLRASLEDAEIQVYEGLPHPGFETPIFAEEMKRGDVEMIGGHGFYTPSTTPKDQTALKQILRANNNIQVRPENVEKACGGFHPDYAVSWTVNEIVRHALICLGCGEVVFLEGNNQFRYDLAHDTSKRLKTILSQYASKRPPIYN
jgi:hypothetical protein